MNATGNELAIGLSLGLLLILAVMIWLDCVTSKAKLTVRTERLARPAPAPLRPMR